MYPVWTVSNIHLTHQIEKEEWCEEDAEDAAQGRVEEGGRLVAAGRLGQDDGRGDRRRQAAQGHEPALAKNEIDHMYNI